MAGRIVLSVAAFSVAAGGLYDLFVPVLPQNLAILCGGQPGGLRLVRELLRALGGALSAIGFGSMFLIARMGINSNASTLIVVLILIVPAELINALAMRRVGSPFYVPLLFAALALIGAALSWPRA